jgi:hypothetical protein
MKIPTLVVSDPPHGEVDLGATAELLGLDVFAARLKASFRAPEVMAATDPLRAGEFAAALRATGFDVSILDGAILAAMPWPDPVSTLAFDASHLQATIRDEGVAIPYDAEVVAVHCAPPDDRPTVPTTSRTSTLDLERAVASGHGPTIAEAVQRRSILDLYFRDAGSLRRATIVPDLLKSEMGPVKKEVVRRFRSLRLDDRLAGVRPRAPFGVGAGFDGRDRRRYSFGTQMLREVLESIAPELRAIPQYEFGSRLAYALGPIEPAPESALGA